MDTETNEQTNRADCLVRKRDKKINRQKLETTHTDNHTHKRKTDKEIKETKKQNICKTLNQQTNQQVKN